MSKKDYEMVAREGCGGVGVTVTTNKVRRTLKAAGLEGARVETSKQVTGYSVVVRAGFKTRYETEYRRKVHERTGRVLVDFLVGGWTGDRDRPVMEAAMETAQNALVEAGFTVAKSDTGMALAVSA